MEQGDAFELTMRISPLSILAFGDYRDYASRRDLFTVIYGSRAVVSRVRSDPESCCAPRRPEYAFPSIAPANSMLQRTW